MRRKSSKYSDLPLNLTAYRKGGRTYYRYRHPKTKKYTSFSVDRAEAIKAAHQLNGLINTEGRELVARVLTEGETLGDYCQYWLDELVPNIRGEGESFSDTTRAEYSRMVKVVVGEAGHIPLALLTQSDIATFLKARSSNEVANKYRQVLISIFKHALSDGKLATNFAERIVARPPSKKKRQRLTLDEYRAIYQAADPVIRRGMEFALNLQQRNGDLRDLKFEHFRADQHLYIVQSKCGERTETARLRIPGHLPVVHSQAGHKTLAEMIAAARDNTLCPYILHEVPERKRKSQEKDHWAQLPPKRLSKGFAEARDGCGLFDGVPEEKRPTFYECVSLGMHLRLESGWTKEEIQTLKGHSTADMTAHYLEGHGYTTVKVPVDLAGRRAGAKRRKSRKAAEGGGEALEERRAEDDPDET